MGAPEGGKIYAVTVFRDTVFAGTVSGIRRSYDNGTHWTESDEGLPAHQRYRCITALAVSGRSVFAGNDIGYIFRSANNGASWTKVFSGKAHFVSAFAVNGSTIFAGTLGGGPFLSTANGATWNPVNSGLTNHNVYSLAP